MFSPMFQSMFQDQFQPQAANLVDIAAAKAALGEKWQFQGDLNGTNGTPVIFTRASEANYPNVLGKYINYPDDAPAYGVGLLTEGAGTSKNTGLNDGSTAASITKPAGDGLDASVATFSAAEADGIDLSEVQHLIDDDDIAGLILLDATAATIDTQYAFQGSVGNTNPHTFSILSAVVNGGSVTMGLAAGLIGSVSITGSKLTRFYSANVTPAGAGNGQRITVPVGEKCYVVIWNLCESEILQSPIIGAAGSRALVDSQVSTAGMPVNDCAYYIEMPRGIRDNGLDQFIFDSVIDANNRFRVLFDFSVGSIRVQKRSAAASYNLDLAYTADGSPVQMIIKNDSTGGFSAELSNGSTATDANTGDLQLNSVINFGTNSSQGNPLFSEIANFKYFNTSDITLEAAARA